ncbi:MAG: hypothetical protein CVV24_13170 [Ignavibacteriae bacterium HGW-Ignavibacteriae-3]|nr:MAG: hypothetical protein CVV24_13170 [Ignavibacteriae bacterium HGW-Ignavibacteriae-3]
MIIKYTNFSDGIHSFQLSDLVSNLGLEELFVGDVIVDCKMDKSIHQIVLDCDLSVNAKLVCDRCAIDIETNLTSHFQISYLFSRDTVKSDEYNVKYLSADQEKIDLKDDIYEYAELSIPLKSLCNEECKGLCPQCGINLNENKCNCKFEPSHDVWEPLKKLKGKFNN